jgi:hypothetical protein
MKEWHRLISTFSMKGLFASLIQHKRNAALQQFIECSYTECLNLFLVMLNVIMLNVVGPITDLTGKDPTRTIVG